MGFRRATTWKERGQQLQTVKDKCNAILEKLTLPDTDARAMGMMHVRGLCNTVGLVPIMLHYRAQEEPGNLPCLIKILDLPDKQVLRGFLEDLNANGKISFLTCVQFALENLVNRILEGLDEKPAGSFKASVKKLIENTSITDIDAKLELVCVPQYIRNTLHNNGVHTHSDCSFDVGGETYVFKKGKDVSCATWSHIFHAVSCALDVYEEIMLTPAVKGVEHIAAS